LTVFIHLAIFISELFHPIVIPTIYICYHFTTTIKHEIDPCCIFIANQMERTNEMF